ncbi:ABC transporter ATP-binding protein [Oceanirhabdus sp. W0125-5]|uniref:ABC transporter ATP-binding protein n=1 Tax=Oceanirhabdus sp. W0125-5 TaxID=2999116 RepID=UPI0022F2DABD|nr:ABC transporter ATP-binding protein [Oceanirhabdus sp. W0125-5]WBW95611.1 ABC transporter ATP-binding protein [Oceanirhabdus sp. W0125-5]
MVKEKEKKNYVIDCENLIKIYKTEEFEVVALQGMDLRIEEGEFTAIIGNSGSGKSTLLNMIGGLDKASAGKLIVDGKDLFKLNEEQLIKYKRDSVGFVWQNNARNLLPYLTAMENIELVLSLKKEIRNEKLLSNNRSINVKNRVQNGFKNYFRSSNNRARALELLEMVELSHRKNNRLFELSGGQQQRVAIAIALANNPKILLADEPTGSVDTKTSDKIFSILRKLNEEMNQTILIVTHDRSLAKKVDRVISISDGRTNSEFIRNRSYADRIGEIGSNFEENDDTHDEYAVVDRIGRLHLPKDYIEKMNLKNNRLRVRKNDDEIILFK